MQSPTSHHGSEKEHIGSDYFLTFLPLSLRLSWAGAWVTGGRDVCPLLGVGGRSCIGSAATSGCERCYAGEAWTTMGEQTPVSVSIFRLFYCYSVILLLFVLLLWHFYCYSKLFCFYCYSTIHLGCERCCYAGEAWTTMGEQTPVSVSALLFFSRSEETWHIWNRLCFVFFSDETPTVTIGMPWVLSGRVFFQSLSPDLTSMSFGSIAIRWKPDI